MRTEHRAVGAFWGRRMGLCLVTGIGVLAFCAASDAQILLGSSGGGWQTWNLNVDAGSNFIDLNSNRAPYWDVPFLTFNAGGYGGQPAAKSVGWCLTSTGDCQGVGSALAAPGPLPFWGMPYTASSDSGGAMDHKMYFATHASGETFEAVLYLNTATNNTEINQLGWFETNATGTVNGPKHVLFQGSGYPPGTHTPDRVGKRVTFKPTHYFGFYYEDVSDPETLNGPVHGCWAYTIFNFNDEDCTAAGGSNGPGQGDHVFAIFRKETAGQAPTYWVAGQDPTLCSSDGDCNLTIVRLRRVP